VRDYMHEKRIVFWGTRGQELTSRHLAEFVRCGANLVGFVEAPPGSISTVHTEKDPFEGIDAVAKRLSKPLLCPKNARVRGLAEELEGLKPDVFIIICYQFYIPEYVLSVPKLGAINFHTSLLPRHAGMHPGFWTIWYGDSETGMVVHHLDAGIDTGDIIYETRVPVHMGETINEVYHRVWDSSTPLVSRLLDDLDNGTLPRRPQDLSRYLYNYEIVEKDLELDFRQPAVILFGRVSMRPGQFFFVYNNRKYYVKSCRVVEELVHTRKFLTNVPYNMDGKLTFVTPRKFLQIDEIMVDGKAVDPVSIIG
jgi:methionyl-tRNA formyltransferase